MTNLNRIFYCQKRVVRAITNSDYREHTAPVCAKLNILVNALQIAKFIFYYHNQLLPPMFLSLFPANRLVHSYDTRIANFYQPHNCRTNLKQFATLYQGPQI